MGRNFLPSPKATHGRRASRLRGGSRGIRVLAYVPPAMGSWQTQAKAIHDESLRLRRLIGVIVIPAPMIRGSGNQVYP